MQTKLAVVTCVAGLAISGWAHQAAAHHAFAAEFDANKPVNFKGTITKMEWINPHSWLHVAVKQEDGTVINWAIEAGTPNVLFRRGFTKDTLQPGTEVVTVRRAPTAAISPCRMASNCSSARPAPVRPTSCHPGSSEAARPPVRRSFRRMSV